MEKVFHIAVIGLMIVVTSCMHEKPVIDQPPPSQVVQMQKQFEQLKEGDILDIREVDGKGWVQVCMGNDGENGGFQLFYPNNENPSKAFHDADMVLPPSWEVVKNVTTSETFLVFYISNSEVTNNLSRFIHDYFIKFLKQPSTYKMTFRK